MHQRESPAWFRRTGNRWSPVSAKGWRVVWSGVLVEFVIAIAAIFLAARFAGFVVGAEILVLIVFLAIVFAKTERA